MPPSRSKKSRKARNTRKSAPKRSNVSKSNKRNASSLSVNGIKKRFSDLDTNMREYIAKNRLHKPQELVKHVSRQWNTLFKKNLTGKAAATLAHHYANLHNKKGGSLGGAPLDYVMRPGLPGVSSYGVFPTEAGADPKSVSHLDVYYNSALGRSCGTENTSAVVPKDLGSNLVPAKGGKRRSIRRKHGGDFMTSLSTRQYTSDSPANMFQGTAEKIMGQAPWGRDNADPTAHIWKTVSSTGSLLDPNGISPIQKDITQLANPSPYPSVR